MKKLSFLILIGIAASCGPKPTVAVTPVEPAVQTPPKPQDAPKETSFSGPLSSADLAAGKSLFENTCVKCHRLYSPKEYSAKEWQPIIKRMQIKARIDDVETASIYNYIVSQL